MKLLDSSLYLPGGHRLLDNNFRECSHEGGRVPEQVWLSDLDEKNKQTKNNKV